MKMIYEKKDMLCQTEEDMIKWMTDGTKGLSHPNDKVTTEQFVTILIRSCKGDIEPTRVDWSSGYIDYAFNRGIMDDYDRTNSNHLIERRSAARIVHQIILTEFSERDEEDWSAADKLLDLYSCRTCVMHIAQVYVKGIMFCRNDNLFDLKENITLSEAAAIAVRMLNQSKRIPQNNKAEAKSNCIHPEEAWDMMLHNSRSLLIDVRTYEEYKQGHLDHSICLPLNVLIENPDSVCGRKDTPIILYCQRGYKSALAAQTLINVGFSKVYTIPGIEQYPYSL